MPKYISDILIFAIFFSYSVYGMEVSYTVLDIANNKIIEKKGEDKPMVLASISKIYSTYYILNQLNPTDKFETKILISKNAKIKNRNLEGDLAILPSGDPYITAQNFIDLIYQVKSLGITSVKGNFLVVENNLWEANRLSPIGLEDQADNSSMGALNFEFNRFKVDRLSNSPIPPMNYLKINERKLNEPGLKFKLEKSGEQEVWTKNKNEEHKRLEEIPTRSASIFSGEFFRYLADLHGLVLTKPKVVNEFHGESIASHLSLPISRLVELCLEYSNNLMAEMLLQKATNFSPEKGSEKMLNWYKENYPNINWKDSNFVNASGLSLENQTTSKNLTTLLGAIYGDSRLPRNFLSFLSINGHSGGVRKRLNSPQKSFRVYAKTGSLFFVNNLAGFFIGKSGKLYSFSIFTTDGSKRNILNQKNSIKVDKIRRENKAWHHQSTQKIDSLLSNFINKL